MPVFDCGNFVALVRQARAPRPVGPGAERVVPVIAGGAEPCRHQRGVRIGAAGAGRAGDLLSAGLDSQAARALGSRIGRRGGFCEQRGCLHGRRLAPLVRENENQRQGGRARGRPAHRRRRQGPHNAGRQRAPFHPRINPFEPAGKVLPGGRRGRQAGGEALAVAHAVVYGALQPFQLGAALPAGLQVAPHLAGLPAGQFAVQVAQQLAVVGVAHSQVHNALLLNRAVARRRNSPTADALMPKALAISGYRNPSRRRNRHLRCCSERPSTAR